MTKEIVTREDAYYAFTAADEAWTSELDRLFGDDACDARYDGRGKGAPGSKLRRLHRQFRDAAHDWNMMG